MTTKFPLTLKAMQQGEKVQWAIGDALIKECDPPGEHGVNTGSDKKLEQAQEEANRNGFDYDFRMMEVLRQVANDFPARIRIRSINWSIHRIAGDPETLQEIIKKAKGKKLTAELARELKRGKPANDDKPNPNPRPKPKPLPDLGDDPEPEDGIGLSRESLRISSLISDLEEATEILQGNADVDADIFQEFVVAWQKFNRVMQNLPRSRMRVIKGGKA